MYLGEVITIHGELYQVVHKLKIPPGKVLPEDMVQEMRKYWMCEKTFRNKDILFFVNEIKTVEPIYDQDRGETNSDSPESTAG